MDRLDVAFGALGLFMLTGIVLRWSPFFWNRNAASDIFFAGFTQTPAVFFIMAVSLLGYNYHDERPAAMLPGLKKKNTGLSRSLKVKLAISFVLNAPLIFIYPVLNQSQVL